MDKPSADSLIKNEYQIWKSRFPERIEVLNSGSGSNRQYYRIIDHQEHFIATINNELKENESFFYLSSYYVKQGIRLPEVCFISSDRSLYFQQDIGDVNLLQLLKENGFNEQLKLLYQSSLRMLWKMQSTTKGLDYSICYPREAFDKQSILWDLNYFKYYFLKVSALVFDEQLLENDMQILAEALAVKPDDDYFMFRDFQARNIQIFNGEPWFIDFQGGRRGPFLYDVASLLFQASAGLDSKTQDELLAYYRQLIGSELELSEQQFQEQFRLMVFVRIIQTLGAYGFRGLLEGKAYFKNSIPAALHNLESLLAKWDSEIQIPYFLSVLQGITEIKHNFDQ